MEKTLYGIDMLTIDGSNKPEQMNVYAYANTLDEALRTIAKTFDKHQYTIGHNLADPKYTTDDVYVFRILRHEAEKFYSDTNTEDMTISRSLYIKSGIYVNLHMMKNKGQRLVILTADYNGFELHGEQGTGIIENTIEKAFATELVVTSNRGNVVSGLVAIVIAG